MTVETAPTHLWVDAEGGYQLALAGKKLLCKNAKGKELTSVPKKVRESEVGQQLLGLKDWLVDHQLQCRSEVDQWMLRSLPVPSGIIKKAWPDPAWRALFENAVVASTDDKEVCGFLKAIDEKKGLGIVDLDGETQWLKDECISFVHPALLDDLSDWRELATELKLKQGNDQLYRETFEKPKDGTQTSIGDYKDGKFEQLRHAYGRCKTLGYLVSGGFAKCALVQEGKHIDALFWIGAEDPESETSTGELTFADASQKTLTLDEVPAVAYSEGMRMAAAIYASRVIKKEGDQEEQD